MLRLTVLRHGHALDRHASGRDFDRELSDRGVEQVRQAAAALTAVTPPPQLILASPAARTRRTAELLQQLCFEGSRVEFDKRLYLASLETLTAITQAPRPEIEHLLLVGHNPGLSELCRSLGDQPELEELRTAGSFTLSLIR